MSHLQLDPADIHGHFEMLMQRSFFGILSVMKRAGLSMPQIYVLIYLYHAGAVPVSEIGTLTGVTKGAASQMVERLAQQDLIERSEDPADRRVKKIGLRPKSLALIKKGLAAQRRMMAGALANLSPEQQSTVQAAFQYLTEALLKSGPPGG